MGRPRWAFFQGTTHIFATGIHYWETKKASLDGIGDFMCGYWKLGLVVLTLASPLMLTDEVKAQSYVVPEGAWCELEVTDRSGPIESFLSDDGLGDEIREALGDALETVVSDQCEAYLYMVMTRALYLVDRAIKEHFGKDLIFKDRTEFKNLIRGLDTRPIANFRFEGPNISKADVINVFLDVLNKELTTNIHLFTQDKRFQKPLTWVIDYAFLWGKAGITYSMAGGNKADAAVARFEIFYGHGEIAYQIFYDVFEAGDQYSDATTDAAEAEARLAIIELYSQTFPRYMKADPVIGSQSKSRILAQFEEDCEGIIDEGYQRFFIQTEFSGYRKLSLQNECGRLYIDLKRTDTIKTSILISLAKEGRRQAFDHYADLMFSSEQAVVLKSTFAKIGNSAFFFDTSKNAFVTKYLVAGAALNITINGDQNGNFNPGQPISHVEALALVSRAFFPSNDRNFTSNPDLRKYYQYIQNRITLSDTSISASTLAECSESLRDKSSCLSKKDMAKLLVRSSGMPLSRSSVSQAYSNRGWDTYSLSLKDNDIVHGHTASQGGPANSWGTPPLFTVKPQISRAEFLKMLVRTKVHTLCGNEYRIANRPDKAFCTSLEGFLEAQI